MVSLLLVLKNFVVVVSLVVSIFQTTRRDTHQKRRFVGLVLGHTLWFVADQKRVMQIPPKSILFIRPRGVGVKGISIYQTPKSILIIRPRGISP